ncbi:hypothetical protein OZX67_08580 [Bifidobacterium sp. ESL0728]|uniref:type IV toxin-antitoxin system AbiEi family antitoxin domain-containing protein n=1 Tax=Bifidobacterium sp. ESL0728 TaxID=2983220 RepID=UPI0023F8FD3D|nr:hypothetical protein [Bifidobacterium sp. ESL0728]WEV58829.1 hypothetical protein OZX67_08580 [Bifidobacterium sp. ESL0728]
MVAQYVFYKRKSRKEISDAVREESAVFNNVLSASAVKKIYDNLQERQFLLQKVFLSGFRNYLVSPEANLFKELRISKKGKEKDLIRLIPRNEPVSPYAVALSLSGRTYISHYSALYLNDLTLNIPKPIYVKKKRTKAKPSERNEELSQAQIDQAFAAPARMTNNIYTFNYDGRPYEVYLLDQSATIDKGITEMQVSNAPSGISVSGIEKTLIECTVKPEYSGGAQNVLEAFARAKGELKVLRMMQLLDNGEYWYPYGKNILFYMDRAGYSEKQKNLVVERLNPNKQKFNMYLQKNMHDKLFDPDIGIYYPKGLGAL